MRVHVCARELARVSLSIFLLVRAAESAKTYDDVINEISQLECDLLFIRLLVFFFIIISFFRIHNIQSFRSAESCFFFLFYNVLLFIVCISDSTSLLSSSKTTSTTAKMSPPPSGMR